MILEYEIMKYDGDFTDFILGFRSVRDEGCGANQGHARDWD